MTDGTKTIDKIFQLWPALVLLVGIGFSVSLWSADNQAETQDGIEAEDSEQPIPENKIKQAAEEPQTPSDFKPSEEISEDFPVPLPSDI